MQIVERNYNSNLMRPTPTIFKNQDIDLMVIITAWGQGLMKENINSEISKFIFSSQGDFEVTSPFERNSALTKDGNNLRMAILLANDMIYRSENKEDIKTCYEVLVLFKNKNQLSWVQVGNPNVIFIKNELIPLSFALPSVVSKSDRSVQLPSQFFGTEMHCHFQIGTIEVEAGDKLLLYSDNSLASESWLLKNDKIELNHLVKNQIKANSENPFWMGIVSWE